MKATKYNLITYLQDTAGKPMYIMAMIRKLQSNIDKAIKKYEKKSHILGFSKTIIDIIVPIMPKTATINRVIPSM